MTEKRDVERLLTILRGQKKEAKKRRETEPLERWIAELHASAAVSEGVVVGDLGVFPAHAVQEALRRFEANV